MATKLTFLENGKFMKKLIIILTITLSGCSLVNYIPSKWDGNEAAKATDIQQLSRTLDCSVNTKQSIDNLYSNIKWLETYSQYKGSHDIALIMPTLVKGVTELKDRSDKGPVTHIYCELKKKILIQESDQISTAIQGRFL